jgi:hypothetical protein
MFFYRTYLGLITLDIKLTLEKKVDSLQTSGSERCQGAIRVLGLPSAML